MVGLWNMESKRPVCAYCKIQSVTDCDKTGAPICSKHSAIVPNGAEVNVYARKHAPRSHKKKMEALAIKRGLFNPEDGEQCEF